MKFPEMIIESLKDYNWYSSLSICKLVSNEFYGGMLPKAKFTIVNSALKHLFKNGLVYREKQGKNYIYSKRP